MSRCCDEEAAVKEVRALSDNARRHLSHVVRNGLCIIISSARLGRDVERTVFELESKWRELGL